MLENYQKFDQLDEFNQDQQLNQKPNINAILVFTLIFLQLIYLTGWVTVFISTDFGSNLLYDRQTFAIAFPLTMLATIIFQALLLYQKQNDNYKKVFGVIFLLINGFFVSYLMLILSKNIFIFYIQYTQTWILLIYTGILIISFIIIPSYNSKYRWICILVIPTLINFVMGFFYYHLDLSFQGWLFLFSVVCLYMTSVEYGVGELYLSLNIIGFITLFFINAAKQLYDAFQTQTSQYVTKLKEQQQIRFLFFTYIIAAISTLLTPLINKLFEMYNYDFFGSVYEIHASFWIIFGINYLLYFFLILSHRYLELQVKQFIVLAYYIIHQLSVSGILFLLRYQYSFLIFYYYIGFLQIQFIYAAITLQINQKFCQKSLYHILLMVPIIANFTIFLYFGYPANDVLTVIVNSFLIIQLGQQCLKDTNFYLQFKEDEYMISGALLSDPLALFMCHSILAHFKTNS